MLWWLERAVRQRLGRLHTCSPPGVLFGEASEACPCWKKHIISTGIENSKTHAIWSLPSLLVAYGSRCELSACYSGQHDCCLLPPTDPMINSHTSKTVSSNKPFLWKVALVLEFYHSNRKVMNAFCFLIFCPFYDCHEICLETLYLSCSCEHPQKIK